MIKNFLQELPACEVLRLNAGTTSPTPMHLQRRHQEWRTRQAALPVDVIWRTLPQAIEQARTSLAAMIAGNPGNLLLLPNATFGMNTVVQSLTLKEGDVILASDHEYHHTWKLWREICAQTGAKVRRVRWPTAKEAPDLGAGKIAEAFAKAWCPQTKVVTVSHITSCSGLLMPVQEICQMARERNAISIVDGAHALGQVPLNMESIGADLYVGTCHKWLMGPINSGFTYVASHRRAGLKPLLFTDFANVSSQELDEPTAQGATKFQMQHEYQSTVDRTAQALVHDAVAWRLEMGEAAVFSRCQDLSAAMAAALTEAGYPLQSQRGSLATNMVTVVIPDADPINAWRYFHDHRKIDLAFPVQPTGEVCLRVSAAWFVEDKAIATLVDALRNAPWSELT